MLFEQYDEIIFYEPTEYMYEILQGTRKIEAEDQKDEPKPDESDMHPHDLFEKGTYKLKLSDEEPEIDISHHFGDFDPLNDVKNLEQGLKFISEEIHELR